jgi:hypothetical protein
VILIWIPVMLTTVVPRFVAAADRGARMTENPPPIEGKDLTDHQLLHPGPVPRTDVWGLGAGDPLGLLNSAGYSEGSESRDSGAVKFAGRSGYSMHSAAAQPARFSNLRFHP